MIAAQFEKSFEGWRSCARGFLEAGVSPAEIAWDSSHLDLLDRHDLGGSLHDTPKKNTPLTKGFTVPPEFIKLAQSVCYARDDSRWALLYRILFRLKYETPHLLKIFVDPDIHRANLLAKAIRRDIHKMHAFVRFKKVMQENQEHYVAWHKPEHLILRPGSAFFQRRFGDRPWSIFTPDESAHWDLNKLTFGPGMEQRDFKTSDEWDEVWKTYYRSIFNPARIKMKAMKKEMAPQYWAALPESQIIYDLIREAPDRLQKMAKEHKSSASVEPSLNLEQLKISATSCRACPIGDRATQVVFGEGPQNARVMIVGEQPGDQEDLKGAPFQGPAGEILNRALKNAGLSREQIYITNAVKHFKWQAQGKARIHQKPTGAEMHACKPWLDAEIAKVKPELIVALGATAATVLLGRLPKISEERGQLFSNLKIAPHVLISWHPSAILRSPSEKEKLSRTDELTRDLQLIAKFLGSNAT